MKKLWILGLSLMLNTMMLPQLLAASRHREPVAKIYYIPFQVQTYIPVTPQTIEQAAHQKLVLHEESGALHQLIAALDHKTTPGRLDEQMVRLKVVWRFQVYLVDAGGGARSRGLDYQVTASEIEELVKAVLSPEKKEERPK